MATKTITGTRVPAKEAKNRFGELLEAVQRHPIIITKNNRPVAELRRISEKTRFEEVEDEIWAEKVRKIMKNPQFLGPKKSEEFMNKLREKHARSQPRY
ncbi:prevent-host-death protein [Candidatus Kaiserbacteria bacterium CG10_big_fil_rev_8_21_14_0_10_51_14]|uniref:Antitoxin n=1 Tax=Candidatus Kaiserbacteria bacterium CG10_big_fil_rev_8_21_14_0_10_51_14 TaxID=1974610 RepID=A0A2H0UCS1_9BACT|nr:MAG: prevent-host-death protein [Candidatus Kaiserbacteria bacterium CG10_big_fil_rev_8_21_14_0_10_51_14]